MTTSHTAIKYDQKLASDEALVNRSAGIEQNRKLREVDHCRAIGHGQSFAGSRSRSGPDPGSLAGDCYQTIETIKFHGSAAAFAVGSAKMSRQ
jgi:hypothetical protein